VFALGQAVPGVAGPVLVTTLAVTVGVVGWLALAGIFAVCAAVCRYPAEWAQRGRSKAGEARPATVR